MFWEKYSRTSGKKQELLSVFSKNVLSVWRKNLTENFLDFFSVSQQGLQTGHYLCWEIFRGKIHFKRTIFIFTVFGRWSNGIYASRGTFCLEIQFWRFFHQGMTLSQKFLYLAEFRSTFFRNRLLRHHKNF